MQDFLNVTMETFKTRTDVMKLALLNLVGLVQEEALLDQTRVLKFVETDTTLENTDVTMEIYTMEMVVISIALLRQGTIVMTVCLNTATLDIDLSS